MFSKTKKALLVSTVILSWGGWVHLSVGSQWFSQAPDGTIKSSQHISTGTQISALKSLLESLKSDPKYGKAATEALEAWEKTAGAPIRKANTALEKFNSVIGAVQHLSEAEKKVVMSVRKAQEGRSDKQFDALVDSLGYLLEHGKESNLKTASEGKDIETKEGRKITVARAKWHGILGLMGRKSTALTPSSGLTSDKIFVDSAEYGEATSTITRLIEEQLKAGSSQLTPEQRVNIFTRGYSTFETEKARDEAFEELINALLDQKEISTGAILTLCRFFGRVKITKDIDQELKEYATYYMVQMEDNAELGPIVKQYNVEVGDTNKQELRKQVGPVWNALKESGDIDKFSLTSLEAQKKGDYIKDQTAIPLINLLRKNPSIIFQKSPSQEIGAWIKLVPYTPYNVIASLYYMVTLYGISPDAYLGNDTTKAGYIGEFLEKIHAITAEGKDAWEGEDKIRKKSKMLSLPSTLQDSFISFYGKQDSNLEKFNNFDDNTTGLYDSATDDETAAVKKGSKRFKLNQAVKADYIQKYQSTKVARTAVATKKLDKATIESSDLSKLLSNRAPSTPAKRPAPTKAALSSEEVELQGKILHFIENGAFPDPEGPPPAPPLEGAYNQNQEIFLKTAMRALKGKHDKDDEIEGYLREAKKEGHLPEPWKSTIKW